jgi:hypothetical protein
MPAAPDTSDLRALARVILDREDLDQSAMRASVRPYELAPVRRRVLEGARVGLLAGVGLGLASVGSGTARTFQPPQWAMYFGLFIVMTIAIGAAVGAGAGLVVRSVQRRRLDRELVQLTDPVDGSLRDRGEHLGDGDTSAR